MWILQASSHLLTLCAEAIMAHWLSAPLGLTEWALSDEEDEVKHRLDNGTSLLILIIPATQAGLAGSELPMMEVQESCFSQVVEAHTLEPGTPR